MGFFSKDIKTMEDLLLHGLQDIYYAEHQITKALPKMIDLATNRDLSKGLSSHLEETRKQIERLDRVFEKLGKQPSGTDCPAIAPYASQIPSPTAVASSATANSPQKRAAAGRWMRIPNTVAPAANGNDKLFPNP